jgi:hypothetical protein
LHGAGDDASAVKEGVPTTCNSDGREEVEDDEADRCSSGARTAPAGVRARGWRWWASGREAGRGQGQHDGRRGGGEASGEAEDGNEPI